MLRPNVSCVRFESGDLSSMGGGIVGVARANGLPLPLPLLPPPLLLRLLREVGSSERRRPMPPLGLVLGVLLESLFPFRLLCCCRRYWLAWLLEFGLLEVGPGMGVGVGGPSQDSTRAASPLKRSPLPATSRSFSCASVSSDSDSDSGCDCDCFSSAEATSACA